MRQITAMLAALALVGATAAASKAPATWDGLVLVKSKKVSAVYLLPHADFRAYSKVMFDPPEVAFQKNWERDYNRSTMAFTNRVTDADVRKDIDEAQTYLAKIFPDSFTKAGFETAAAPGPDVLKLSVYVINVTVTAPDTGQAMGATLAMNAGEATLAIEVRDSLTGQLLGRVVDPQVAGDDGFAMRRNYGTNRQDFEALFDTWAKISARGLTELRAQSPIDTDGLRKK